ncbi:MAG: hypothetical protein GYB64_19895, partial [Chloroflexi bacterium]|nr:hypothetical protein [Chloroflexota bacterium]
MKAAIPQQHPALHRPQQADAADPFTGLAGPEPGIDHGVGATLDQIDALELGKGAVTTVPGVSPEGAGI